MRAPWKALAARSPKTPGGRGGGSKGAKPAGDKAKPAPKPSAPKPAAKTPASRSRKSAPKYPPRPERLALRQMGRGRKPPNLPETPLLPPAPPSAPDYQGAAPTMHYGEAPVPPKKKSKRNAQPKSTAAKAAEAARAAVWSVSSEKTTMQIEAAENAFEEALGEHKAKESKVLSEAAEAMAEPKEVEEESSKASPAASPRKSSGKDRWTFFREELAREDDPDDPHYNWRQETGRPRHEMFLPAPEERIAGVEAELKTKLPPSYREFNTFWGGGRLYTQEFREIRLVGALELFKELKDRLCERMHSPWLPLADLGDGDYLAFDTSKPNVKGEYAVHWWYGGHPKKRVAASFQDWLEQLIASGGEAFWWEES